MLLAEPPRPAQARSCPLSLRPAARDLGGGGGTRAPALSCVCSGTPRGAAGGGGGAGARDKGPDLPTPQVARGRGALGRERQGEGSAQAARRPEPRLPGVPATWPGVRGPITGVTCLSPRTGAASTLTPPSPSRIRKDK